MRLSTTRVLAIAGILLTAAAAATGAAAQQPPTPAAPAITAVIPKVVFANDNGTYDVEVRGTGFVAGHAPTLQIEGAPGLVVCDASKPTAGCVKVAARGQGWTYSGIDLCSKSAGPVCYAGARKVTVQVGDGGPSDPVPVAFSTVDFMTPYEVTAGVLVVLLGIVVGVLRQGPHCHRLANGEEVSLAEALLLDAETSTYSLSKLQFYAWTAAAIAGYVYLTVARSLVQGQFAFPAVPDNLPGILLISVGTGVVSTVVAGTTGDKGSGCFKPELSDLITSGGVVAPERLQFLVWTVLGVLTFLFTTFSIGPDQITDLPPIPSTFLQLMGISSAGYLGGKLARGPGPKIVGMTAQVAAGKVTLKIDGTALGTQGASYFLADLSLATPTNEQIMLAPDTAASKIDASSHFATHLEATANAPAWLAAGKKARFIIVNQDGEKAVWEFTPS